MIRCNSPYTYGGRCVADMDSQQSHGGTICCDTAEDLDFDGERILEQCEYAERMEDMHTAKETGERAEQSISDEVTEQKAIKTLKHLVLCGMCTTGPCDDCERKLAKDVAVQALEEIQKYRSIGTVTECREAMEKQRAKKVVGSEDNLIGYDDDGNPIWETEYTCTECGMEIVGEYGFCPYCGQALDWRE